MGNYYNNVFNEDNIYRILGSPTTKLNIYENDEMWHLARCQIRKYFI